MVNGASRGRRGGSRAPDLLSPRGVRGSGGAIANSFALARLERTLVRRLRTRLLVMVVVSSVVMFAFDDLDDLDDSCFGYHQRARRKTTNKVKMSVGVR
jgi:hypothetical protein